MGSAAGSRRGPVVPVWRGALKTMLHRARSLLGADLLVVRDGQIAFDERLTFVDTWAFEHVWGRIESLLGTRMAASRVDDGELETRRAQLCARYRGHLSGARRGTPIGAAGSSCLSCSAWRRRRAPRRWRRHSAALGGR